MFGIIPFFSMNKLSVDPDAQAFIDAAGITDETQQEALDTFVVGLKADSLWTKMLAIYPLVGGTSQSHKYNLKDPQDTDAAFRLTYGPSMVHSSTGMLNNTTTTQQAAYTFFTPSTDLPGSDAALTVYCRINLAVGGYDWGVNNTGASLDPEWMIASKSGTSFYGGLGLNTTDWILYTNSDSRGFYSVSHLSGTTSIYKDGSSVGSRAHTLSTPTNAISLGTWTNNSAPGFNSPATGHEYAFASISEGLDATDNSNLYTLVQAFNTTLSRNIWEDADTQAFIDATGITDYTQQSAVNDLVVGLKADSLWTKMTALYPIVGGTADTHKYNLKDPQDTDGAYRITWSGGITHSSTGADPNGTTGEGDTHLDPSSTTDGHMSFYSRDNTWQSGSVGTDNIDMGGASSPATRYLLSAGLSDTNSPVVGFGDPINTQTGAADGYFLGVLDGTDSVLYKNGSVLGTASISSISDGTFNIGLFHAEGVGGRHTNRECAFASIGSKLTSTEAANLNTLVQAFNTTLSRNV